MTSNPKFLQSVADFLLSDTSDHRDTLLVFPNKRAIMFMRRYLKRAMRGPVFMPRMRTVGAFISSFSDLAEASRIEQIFTLYDAYCQVAADLGVPVTPFDRFRFWGEIMLDDFDDIDRQMANPVDVFRNVKRLEEIQVDFLDEDQRQVARELWGYEPAAFEGFKNNRKRKEGEDDILYQEFVRLNEMLEPVYSLFQRMLEERGLASRGRLARIAAETVESDDDALAKLPENICFIGFGVLSGAERRIFKTLRNLRRARFFWDVPTMLSEHLPEEMKRYRSPLSKYVHRLVSFFKEPDGYEPPQVTGLPRISIISSPSNVMQAKIAGNIMGYLNEERLVQPRRADDSVIVLPDTSLLIPLLHSLRISPVNVTMGLPIRNTPFATLLSLIIRLNMTERVNSEGEHVYLTRNVVQILTHPSLTTILPEETLKLRAFLEKEGRFVTPASLIAEVAPGLSFVFEPIGQGTSAHEARGFLTRLVDGLLKVIEGKSVKTNDSVAETHEILVLRSMRAAVESLVDIVERHSRNVSLDTMNKISFFRLVEKLLFHEQLNFKGSPLIGVQVMGALETRSLDFNNVIMLSMNEKTFPPKNFMRSLIPTAVRAGYGLSTTEERELEYAWIYANLLSRSKRVYLVYNSAAETRGSGGKSRYLYQSEYIFNKSLPLKVDIVPGAKLDRPAEIVIRKTPEVMEQLERFKAGGDRNLSVSALEKFGECGLKFYLSKVCGVREPKNPGENIDDATIGTVIHSVMETLFDKGVIHDNVDITQSALRQVITDALNHAWFNDAAIPYVDLPVEARMQVDFWQRKITDIVALERARAHTYKLKKSEMSPYHIYGNRTFDWQVTPAHNVRFTFFIDRVDSLDDGSLRFVDYKTGRDTLQVKSMDNLFWRTDDPDDYRSANKAIFQLLTYAHAYSDLMQCLGKPLPGSIKLEITQVLHPEKSIGAPLKIGESEITGHLDEGASSFRENLERLVDDLFDPAKPFVQTPVTSRCLYCQFKNICRRDPEKSF